MYQLVVALEIDQFSHFNMCRKCLQHWHSLTLFPPSLLSSFFHFVENGRKRERERERERETVKLRCICDAPDAYPNMILIVYGFKKKREEGREEDGKEWRGKRKRKGGGINKKGKWSET